MHVMHQQPCGEDHLWAVPFIEVKTVIKYNQVILHQLDISDIKQRASVQHKYMTPFRPWKNPTLFFGTTSNPRNQKKETVTLKRSDRETATEYFTATNDRLASITY